MKLPIHRASLTIKHNDHKDVYEPLGQWLADRDDGAFESEEARTRALKTDEYWEMHWYPLTPIGSYTIPAPTLPELLAFALRVEQEYCANTPMLAEIQSDKRHGDEPGCAV